MSTTTYQASELVIAPPVTNHIIRTRDSASGPWTTTHANGVEDVIEAIETACYAWAAGQPHEIHIAAPDPKPIDWQLGAGPAGRTA